MAIYKEDIVDIELTGGNIYRSFCNRAIGEGDALANRFGVRVYRDGTPVALGGSCFGLFIRADGGTVSIVGSVSDNIAYVDLPQACYAIEGQYTLAIKVISGDATGTMRIVDGVVSNTSTDTIVDPGTIIPDISTLIEEIEAAIASIPADYEDLWLSLASAYSTSKRYAVGQYVTYDGGLYRCISRISSPETWTPAHWRQISYGDEIYNNDIGGAVSSIIEGTHNKNYRFPERVTTDLVDIVDGNGNILAAFDYQGNLQSKGINAARSANWKYPYTPLACDFAIQDADGNIAFAIINGLAVTNQRLYGKKLAIVGDSISTFSGWIPSGYVTYYPAGDLDKVYETWWYKLVNELGFTLIRNASWSGSRVSGDSQGTAYAACSDARINALVGDNSELPDIVVCYISTNDWRNNVPVGSFTNKDEIPAEGVISEISKAYALMLYKIRTRYPLADVYCVTSLEGRTTSGDTTYPIINGNGETIHDVNHAITEIAHIFGCKVIDLNVCGIHFWNVANYTVDGTLHPNVDGAEIIKETVKQAMINTYHNL